MKKTLTHHHNHHQTKFVYIDDLEATEKELADHILRLTDFSTHYDPIIKPYIYSQLAIPPLSDTPHEIWTTPPYDTVQYLRHDDIEIARSHHLSIIRVVVPENTETPNASSLYKAGLLAYESLFRCIQRHKLGRLVRIWNYVPNILQMSSSNVSEIDRERYRQFNAGRLDAWSKYGPKDSQGHLQLPASTGVGTHNGPLIVEAVVSNNDVYYIENPRQTPAYHYPARYGSKAPAFARGTLHLPPAGPELYIAGTASIVGSETKHVGNPIAQTIETFNNISSLISSDNLRPYGQAGFELPDLTGIRVYIKNPQNYAAIRQTLETLIPNSGTVAYLNNDICRPDLLLEIEAVARRT